MTNDMNEHSVELMADRVIAAATQAHHDLGSGLTKSDYEAALMNILGRDGLHVSSQVWLPLQVKGLFLNCGAVADLLVEDCLIVKIMEDDTEFFEEEEEVLSCLQMSGKKMGLLLDFNAPTMSDGVKMLALWEPSLVTN